MVIIPKIKCESCLDCHQRYRKLSEYPCVQYKVCPCQIPPKGKRIKGVGENRKSSDTFCCLKLGAKCENC